MTYRFGVFEFEAGTGELRKHGRIVPLEPQPARALGLLLSRAGTVVTRDELRLVVWGAGTHVDFDRGLAYCLSQIRAALGDRADAARFVQTLPRRGFCFVAPVSTSGEPAAAMADTREPERAAGSRRLLLAGAAALLLIVGVAVGWLARSAAADGRVVVAVSIFDNETGAAGYDRLVAGLSDLVVQRLTEIAPARLAIVGNAEVLRRPRNIRNLRAVAAGVRADYVLLGQLQRSGAGLRFITHVIRLRDEAHLRANRLLLPDGDVSGLEAAVVAEFERAIRQHVLGGGQPSPS